MEKKQKNQLNTKFPLIIIGILSIIFLSLLFLSSNKISVKEQINIFDNVQINSLNDDNFYFGNINIENNGFLSKRVNLQKFVLCDLDYNKFEDIQVIYTGSEVKYVKSDIFGFQENKKIDIDSNFKENISLYINNNYVFRETLFNAYLSFIDDNNKNFVLYLYKIDNNKEFNYYNFCENVNKNQAFKKINFDFNLNSADIIKLKKQFDKSYNN